MSLVGAHVSAAGGIVSALIRARQLNLDLFQIFAGSPRTWHRPDFSQEDVDQFLKSNQNPSLLVYIHSLYLINLATADPELLEKSKTSLIADLQVGDRINSSGVIFHIGSHRGRGFDSAKSKLIESLKYTLDITSQTPLILENSAGESGKVGSLEELSFLLHQLDHPRLKLCIDTAHLYSSGYDLSSQKGVDKLASKMSELGLQEHLVCLHVNESNSALGSHQDRHANLGEGRIGQSGLSAFLHHSFFQNLPLILEVPGFDKRGPDRQNVTILRDLAL